MQNGRQVVASSSREWHSRQSLMLVLLDLLRAHWAEYAAEALPRELNQADEETEDPNHAAG